MFAFSFALILITSSPVTSVLYGFEVEPPPDSNPCFLNDVDVPHLMSSYSRILCIPSTKTIIFEGVSGIVLTEFPPIFEEYPELITVSAEQCHIEEIYNDTFVGADKLRFLFLSNNNIEVLFSYSFSLATRLYKLEIRNSNLKKIEPNAFDNLAQLVHLELSDNHIKDLPVGIFDSLTALRTIILSNNFITHIDSNLFMDNRLLSFVYLNLNHIAFVDRETFVKNSVEWLDLANNPGLGLLDLNWGLLDNLIMLKVSNTGLQRIEISPSMNTVLADNNKIDVVVETFSIADPKKPSKLTRLNLAQNKMKNIKTLYPFTQLDTLDLSDNQLDSFDAIQLRSMPNLRKLAVPRNPISGAVNVTVLKERFPMLNLLLLSQSKWDPEYLKELRDELLENNITMQLETDYRPVHLPTTPAWSKSFDPTEFELLTKELHVNFTIFEDKLKILQTENSQQSRTITIIVDRNSSLDEHVKYIKIWLYGIIMFTTIAFIIMTSVYCSSSRRQPT